MQSHLKARPHTISAFAAALALVISGALTFDAAADVTYAYDAGGRLISATDSSGTVIRYTYDSDGNVIEVASTAPKIGQPGVQVPLPALPAKSIGLPIPGTTPAPPAIPATR